LIGVSGANLYAPTGGTRFVTQDFDLFLPLESTNLVSAWASCDAAGLSLWIADEPLDSPRDRWLAERMIDRRALTRVTGPGDLQVDLTLVMKGYEFETVWDDHRVFMIEDAEVPTARLLHIIKSKEAAGRDKDRLFLATHRDALEQLLKHHDAD
jgi:hypothetical protein